MTHAIALERVCRRLQVARLCHSLTICQKDPRLTRDVPAEEVISLIHSIGVEVVEFDAEQATRSGALRPSTRGAGLLLEDRACLALAQVRQLPVLTADTDWAQRRYLDPRDGHAHMCRNVKRYRRDVTISRPWRRGDRPP